MYQKIMKFYQDNGLYQSNHDYKDKVNNLVFFYQFEKIGIEQIHDYCTMRALQGVKNATINREITVIRSAINYYNKHHDDKIINPFNGFNLFESDFMPRYLNEWECNRLLKATLDYDNQMLHNFVMLCLNTGCRAGELTKLKWENVHFDKKYMTIRNALSKNKKTVHKPLNAKSLYALERLKNNSEWVFYNAQTNKNIVSFRRGFEGAVKRSGIGHLRIHDLRHTFASFLVQNGVPLYHVMQLLGHSDIRITQKYAHLSQHNLSSVLHNLPNFE